MLNNIHRLKNEEKQEDFWDFIKFIVLCFIIVVPIRLFIAQPFIVSGHSMDKTLADKQYLIIDEISYRFKEPKRGDVIVFRYPNDPKKFFIKRIIGLPNETVKIQNNQVYIYNQEHKDGLKIDEPYIKENMTTNNKEEKMEEDEYFVMGDNRNESSDSRIWGILKKDKITGKAFLRLFPFTKVDYLPGDYKNY